MTLMYSKLHTKVDKNTETTISMPSNPVTE